MIKRNDLAKQFELVVQQEIKNHNDQMLSTNLAINELRLAVEVLSDKLNAFQASFKSDIKKHDIKDEVKSACILHLEEQLQSHLNDFCDFREKVSAEVKISVENAVDAQRRNEFCYNQLAHLVEETEDLKHGIETLALQTSRDIEESKRIIRKDIDRSKEEVLSVPSEALEIKKELQKQMSVDRVDFSGLLKELRGYKKENFIIDKKFEHIYTLIDRLDKRISK